MSGSIRLALSIIASIILLPIVLSLYLNITPGASTQDIWLAFVQTVPFGDDIARSVLQLWGEAQSGLDGVLNYLTNQDNHFALRFSSELAQLIFGGAVITLIGEVLKKIKIINVEGGLADTIANALIQLLLTFLASLIVNWVFNLFEMTVINTENAIQTAVIIGEIILLTGGGIAILVCLGVIFSYAIVLAALGCIKLCVSYGIFLWLLLVNIQGVSPLITFCGIVVWIGLFWFIQTFEKVFSPQ